MRTKTGSWLLIILTLVGLISCTNYLTREFTISESHPQMDKLYGWSFALDFYAYRSISDELPPERENIFNNFQVIADLSKNYKGPVYGLEIDSIIMYSTQMEEKYRWYKKYSHYNIHPKAKMRNYFRFFNSVGRDGAYIPPAVDTLYLDVIARLYPGRIEKYFVDPYFESVGKASDTISYAIDQGEIIHQTIKIVLLKREFKT
ncbi:MAG: hypothetical protein KAR42_03640 [candidate division Zixibacteria bacterium]|nr:hypothetical protein [candidate division Zixibacteria bacterium]